MEMLTQISGSRDWRAALERKARAVDMATRDATILAGHHIERAVKLSLRTYTHERGTPTPAPPGGPPALVSGALFRSVRTSLTTQIRRGVYRVRVGPTMEYARAQELGYRPRNLPARPYQKPVTRAELHAVRRFYRELWAGALRA